MILVVEGISASGKTTWCVKHGGQHVIAENGRFENEPDRTKDSLGAATFWAERNVDRWQTALAMEDIGLSEDLRKGLLSNFFHTADFMRNKEG